MSESELARVFAKLDHLSTALSSLTATVEINGALLLEARNDLKMIARGGGCAMGERHEREIVALRARPEKALAMAATVAGLVSAIFGGLIWFVNAANP